MKKKILIIDDEVDLTRMVKLNLEATDRYEVGIENKGANSLNAIKVFKPDLVFLDIVMPDADGTNVVQQIKEDKETRHIPVVFLTALVKKEEVKGSSSVIGGYPFLAKPVSTKELIACIEQNLGKPKL